MKIAITYQLYCLKLCHYILIIDDMWHSVPLEDIGIPDPNEANGCKLILTTRSLQVCRGMETQRDVKVNVLSNEEAWDLFRDKAGDVVLSSHVKPIAELVAKECGGLPLAIIAVGHALRQVKDVSVWRNALNELKCPTANAIGTESGFFPHLKLSYDCLRNDLIRACFLYCALYPEAFVIPKQFLIDYWIWEGLIDEVGNREAANDKGQAILNELEDVCLLESADDYFVNDGVKMHDLIRDMAIGITRVKLRFLVKAGLGINNGSWEEEKWEEDVERISLMLNNIQVFPDKPMCPRLSTLFLQFNHRLKEIPPLFFQNMHELKIIDLSSDKIESLPESLSNLENLSALLLSECKKLKTVPSLAKLKKLMALYLHNTAIEELPQGMEFLINLRSLDLHNTPNLRAFPSGVLTKLTLLKGVSMYHSGWTWSTMPNMGGASIDEIIYLTKLSLLYLSFLDIKSFNSYISSGHWRELEEGFYFMIGSVKDQPLLYWKYIVEIDCQKLESSILQIPDKTEALFIKRCHNVVNCSQFFDFSNLRELTDFHIEKCKGLEFIMTEEISLPRLETLCIFDMPDLRELCKQPSQCAFFESLKILDIRWWDNLVSLFSVKLFKQLQNLEKLIIWRCKQMKEMLMEEEISSCADKIKLQRLKSLRLHEMPELESIFNRVISCSSLQSIRVSDCPKLKKLLISIDDELPALEEIKGSREWWDTLEWDDSNAKTHLQTFFKEDD